MVWERLLTAQSVNPALKTALSTWIFQEYCEYSLYLEHFEGISTAPTQAMLTGSKEHEKLEDKFKETATPSTFDDACELSRQKEILSREMYVVDVENGIRGYIDEIWMTPTQIVIIDDKQTAIMQNSARTAGQV